MVTNIQEQDDDEDMSLRKKELTYRGKGLEELKKLDIREFAKLLNSNERRTILRQYDILQKFISRCNGRLTKTKSIILIKIKNRII